MDKGIKNKLLEYWEKITEQTRQVGYFIQDTIDSIKNLIIWFPVIWNDGHWDSTYLLIIMRKKLILMRDHFSSDDAVAMGSKERASEMNKCIKMLDRMIDDFGYGKKCYDAHDEKWGKLDLTFGPVYDKNGNKNENFGVMNFSRPKAITPEQRREQIEEFRECMKQEEIERKKDYDELFETFKKELRTWWD
jgi:hypothetical protein